MKKQTAVEWLAHAIIDVMDESFFRTLSMDKQREMKGIYEQAKTIEMEQHYESYRVGNCFTNSDSLRFEDFFAEYYNETYGGGK